MTYIGIDNGTTGSIGIIHSDRSYEFFQTPSRIEQDYTKKKQNVGRVNIQEFCNLITLSAKGQEKVIVLIERPFVNPGGFRSSLAAVRCMEAEFVVFELLGIPYIMVDSKSWQKELLPQPCSKEQLKKASRDIGLRLFPGVEDMIKKQKDADGILIAEWGRRHNL